MGEGREAGTEDPLVTHPLSTVFYFPFTEQQTPFLTTTVFHHSRENYTLRKLTVITDSIEMSSHKGLMQTVGSHTRQNYSSDPTTKLRDFNRTQPRLICSEPQK